VHIFLLGCLLLEALIFSTFFRVDWTLSQTFPAHCLTSGAPPGSSSLKGVYRQGEEAEVILAHSDGLEVGVVK
jgi:hypothetical protein